MSWAFECPASQDLCLECASRDPLLIAISITRQPLRAVPRIHTMVQFRGTAGILILQLQVRIRSFPRLIHQVPRRKPLYPFVTHCILDLHGEPYLVAGHQTLTSELQVLSSSSCRMTSRQPASSGLPSRPGYLLRMDLASQTPWSPQLVWRNEFRIQIHLASFRGSSFGIRCLARIPTAVMLRGGTVV